MYSSYGSRDCSGLPRYTFHQSDLPSFTVVDLVRTVFAVPGVCKMTTETVLLYGASGASAGPHYEARCWCISVTQCVHVRR